MTDSEIIWSVQNAMILTPNSLRRLAEAIGCESLTVTLNEVTECDGLTVDEANSRVQTCVKAGTLSPRAHAYQVREWLIDSGIDPNTVPQILEASIADEVELKKALSRWEYVTDVPQDHPLVALVAGQLGKDVDAVWWDILKL